MNWSQHWIDVLFLHFPAERAELERLIPAGVELDSFGGQAWISYVLFCLKLRPASLPFIPGFSSLTELNLRTYVRHQGQPGICFLSMHANNCLAIRAAHLLTPLRYQHARLIYAASSGGWRRVECHAADESGGHLSLQFRPAGPVAMAQPGSLDAWLLERYRLFVGARDEALIAADVEHPPWHVSTVEATAIDHTIAGAPGLSLARAPHLMHFSPGLSARFNPFRVVVAPGPLRSVAPRQPARAAGPRGGR